MNIVEWSSIDNFMASQNNNSADLETLKCFLLEMFERAPSNDSRFFAVSLNSNYMGHRGEWDAMYKWLRENGLDAGDAPIFDSWRGFVYFKHYAVAAAFRIAYSDKFL